MIVKHSRFGQFWKLILGEGIGGNNLTGSGTFWSDNGGTIGINLISLETSCPNNGLVPNC